VFYPPSEKVLRVDTQDVPVPRWLGDLICFFKSKVRKSLKPKKGVQALWINRNGKPLGSYLLIVLIYSEYNPYTERITKFVASVFPDKHITPIAFRRIIPTLMWKLDVRTEGESVEQVLERYSRLINTSQKVKVIA
jgi:hypothetical protein